MYIRGWGDVKIGGSPYTSVGECFGGETHGEFVEEFEIAENDKISKRKRRVSTSGAPHILPGQNEHGISINETDLRQVSAFSQIRYFVYYITFFIRLEIYCALYRDIFKLSYKLQCKSKVTCL